MYCIFKVRSGNKAALVIVAVLLVVAIVISLWGPKPEEASGTAGGMGAFTLVIDPGHGGIDGGAVAADGTKESDINLAIALKLRALAEFYALENTMTRQDDSSRSGAERYSEHEDLVSRADFVNAAENPVLISIHQNCYPTGQPSGPQVLYAATESSESLGKLTHQNLIGSLYPGNRRVAEPASKKLYVLNHVSCPAILVECGFLSNLSDLGKLSDSSYQTRLSAVLIASYLQYQSGLTGT